MMRIVIIEDDLEIQAVLCEIFQNEGYEVVSYADKNSVKGIIINRPDLVLLDNKLKDGLGYELCREIKSNDLTKHIPVILTSGYDDLERMAKEAGADGYMAKPLDLTQLVNMANRFAEKRAVRVHKHEDFG
jgi:DNA-binding response OmpR family regulator